MPETVAAPVAPDKPTTPAPASEAERPSGDFMSSEMADFAEMDQGKPAPSMARDPKGKFVKPEEKKPQPAPEKPVEAPAAPAAEKPEAAPDDAEAAPPKPVKAAELRTAYEELKKKVKSELEPEVQRLRQKLKEVESNPKQDAEAQARLKELEERNAQLERHIEYVDFTQSKEYKEKYAEPYRAAWQEALTQFGRLRVREPDGEDDVGEPKFKTRAADETDLLRLGQMTEADLDEAAQREFGASAPRVIQHIERLRGLAAAKASAEKNARETAQQRRKQSMQSMEAHHGELAARWSEINKSLEERFPRAFKADESSPEDVAAHTKGFALGNLLFLGEKGLSPEQVEALPSGFRDAIKAGKPLTPAQQVQLHALARIKIANHDRKLAELKKANARIKELETELGQYQQSEPDAGKAGKASKPSQSKDWLEAAGDELRALDK